MPKAGRAPAAIPAAFDPSDDAVDKAGAASVPVGDDQGAADAQPGQPRADALRGATAGDDAGRALEGMDAMPAHHRAPAPVSAASGTAGAA